MYISHVASSYLHFIAKNPAIRKIKQRGYELLKINFGDKVVEIGCGPGVNTVPIARLVGPTGQVVGVDHEPDMVAEAERIAVSSGVRGWTTHQANDATALPFLNDYFDACYSERMFQHLPPPKPEQALAEAARVTKSGGWIVIIDTDWGTLSIDTPEIDIERRIVLTHAARFRNGYAGRQLYRLFRQQGLVDISVEVF